MVAAQELGSCVFCVRRESSSLSKGKYKSIK